MIPSFIPTILHELDDVNVPSPTDGQFLKFDAATGQWIASAGGSGVTVLNDLTDVVITSPAVTHVLRHNGTNFVNAVLAHADLSGIGSNAHSVIDTHLGSTSNPHTVTKAQVSLGNVTDDAQLKRAAGDIATFTEKITPVNGDFLLIEDSAASNAKKRIQIGNLPAGGAGEANTYSSDGIGGVAVIKTKVGVDLPFKSINAGSSKITVTDDTGNSEIDIDVVEANVIHQNLSGAGTNTHTQIDTHIADATIHFTETSIDHGSIAGLADDDHTIYTLLAGRIGGQTLIGGTAASNNLTFQSTSHATKGEIFFGIAGTSVYDEVNGRWGLGTASPAETLDIAGNIAMTGGINFNRTVGDSQTLNFVNSDGNDWYIDAFAGRLRFHEFTPSNVERMTIVAGGSIGMGNIAPASTALLDLTSTAKGFLAPRMTTTQRDAIVLPATGLLIFNTTAGKYQFYNGTVWGDVAGAGGGEANTASNVNVAGVGVFKQKTGVDLEFRGIIADSTKIAVVLDGVNNEIGLDVVEANLTLSALGGAVTDAQVPNTITLDNITQITTRSHTSLTDIGSNAHSVIDTHLAATAAHGATGAVVGTTNTQVLTNKTFTDNVTTFQDDLDNTKKLQLQLSGITTATTRTLTIPDASGTISLTTDAHALNDLTDVVITAVTSGELLKFDGANWINNTLAEAGIAATGHTHVLTAGATDVTALAAELNLLDLAGLSVGQVLRATGASSAAWQALLWADITKTTSSIVDITTKDHDLLAGLADDDHTQYALLAGRATGQALIGGTASGEDLTLQSTANATKGDIIFGTSVYSEDTNSLGLRTATPNANAAMDADGQYYSQRHDYGNSTATLTVDWVNGNTQQTTLNANCTITLSNGMDGGRYLLELKQDATGGRTVTWPASVKWPGGTAPTLTTAANAVDIITLFFNGTDYRGGSTLDLK